MTERTPKPHPQRRKFVEFVLTLSEAWGGFPWGESAVQVNRLATEVE
ncbi:MAG: hypothetical protein ACJA2W_001411 [Planctomycetota bacterium]|jgi:hypothetical protein